MRHAKRDKVSPRTSQDEEDEQDEHYSSHSGSTIGANLTRYKYSWRAWKARDGGSWKDFE